MEPHSLVQIRLQAGMHALDVVLPQRFLHLHSSMTSSQAQQVAQHKGGAKDARWFNGVC